MSSWSALVQITSFTDFFNISNADLMINREITAHRYHSKLNPQIMLIIAATSVANDKKEFPQYEYNVIIDTDFSD